MRLLLSWLLLIAALTGAVYQWQLHKDQYRSIAHIVKAKTLPCSSPVLYSVGAIDPRFNISTQTFVAAIKEAGDVWERAAGRKLFEYVPEGGYVTVNLIYDIRQAATDKLKAMGIRTDQSMEAYQSLKVRYHQLADRVEHGQTRINTEMAVFRSKQEGYNSDAQWLVRRGNVTRAEARRLEDKRRALEREIKGIKREEDTLNANIETLNALATTMNQLIVQFRIDARQYKRAGASMGVYEEGNYQIRNGMQTIDLYKYSDHLQLLHLLAHEMGHALGLDHVRDPQSIMYPLSMAEHQRLTPDDIAELDKACTSPLRRRAKR